MGRAKRADQQLDDAFAADLTLTGKAAETDAPENPAADDGRSTEAAPAVTVHEQHEDDDPLTVLQRSYDELKTEAEKHKQEAEAARAQASQATRTADTYRMQAEQTGLEARQASIAAIDSAAAHAKNNVLALKAEIARAGTAQEWDVLADAQEALAQNITYLQQLADSRAAAENRRATAPAKPAAEDDRVEQFIGSLTPRSQAWLRSHKADVFSSPARQNKAQAAHNMAIADGIEPESDAYFAELDKYMGYGSTENKAAPKTQHQRQSGAVTSAPPARTNPAQPSRSDSLRLTKEQLETAIAIFPDKKREDAIAAYAENLRKIQSGTTNLMTSTNKYRGGYNGI